MKEILFRGQSIDRRKWCEGDLYQSRLKSVFFINYYTEHGDRMAVEVDPETVGQYTGLTDKNGKKVFEGDVVQHFGTYNLEVYIEKGHTKVRWFDTVTNRKETTLFFGAESPYGEFEVVGNIYDNPEILVAETGAEE